MSLIRIFTVGGTIDKVYFDAKSSYEVGPPNIIEVLSGLSLNPGYEVSSLMQKDSLEMTDADREVVHQAVSKAVEDMIIITHGTDTMTNTAKILADISDKTIVLTGALSPALFKNSDAMFNIGAAFTAAQTKPAGIYIAMNGMVFEYDKVRKDVGNNRFVAL
ncbi:MAG: asparaginase [Gammaproteobacteria bacterium]|nr:asparaginase [Gammaproteobacteria bacterium]MBL4727820.1 asparaginase [Gammaproteobacteria bacterium]